MEVPDPHLQKQQDREQQGVEVQEKQRREQQRPLLQQQQPPPTLRPAERGAGEPTATKQHEQQKLQHQGQQRHEPQQQKPQLHDEQKEEKGHQQEHLQQPQQQSVQGEGIASPCASKTESETARQQKQQRWQEAKQLEQQQQEWQSHQDLQQNGPAALQQHAAAGAEKQEQLAGAPDSEAAAASPSARVRIGEPAAAAGPDGAARASAEDTGAELTPRASAGLGHSVVLPRDPSPEAPAPTVGGGAESSWRHGSDRRATSAQLTAGADTETASTLSAAAAPQKFLRSTQLSDTLWRPQPSPPKEVDEQRVQHSKQQHQQQEQTSHPQQLHEQRAVHRGVYSPGSVRASSSGSASTAIAAASPTAGRTSEHAHLNSAFVRTSTERRNQQQQQQQQQHRQAAPQRANLSLVAPMPCSGSKAAATSTLLLQGWLQKWTNLLSSWRPRYFFVYAGFFKYSTTKSSPPKEMFLLNQCRVRLCPHDPVRFEVDVVDQQTLYLRAESQEEKQMWYAAFKQGQRAALSGANRAGRSAAGGGSQRDKQQQQQQQQLHRRLPGDASVESRPPSMPSSSSNSSSSNKKPARLEQQQQQQPPRQDRSTAATAAAPASSSELAAASTTGSASSSSSGSLSGLAGVVASSAAAAAAYATSRLRSFSAAAVQQPSVPPALAPPPPHKPPCQQQQQTQQQRQQEQPVPQQQSGDVRLKSEEAAAAGARAGTCAAAVLGSSVDVPASSSSSSSPLLLAHASQEGEGNAALLDATGAEGPLVLLLESIIGARQTIQEACSKILALQSDVLKSASQISQTGPAANGNLRQQVALLLQRVDELQQLLQQLLQQWERLLSEEYTQRRQLEKSVRSLAKRNYKLDKAQERLLQLSRQRGKLTATEVAAAIAGVRLPDVEGHGTATATAAATAGATVAEDGGGFSTSDSDDDGNDSLEFFDCDEDFAEIGGGEPAGDCASQQHKQDQQQQQEQKTPEEGTSALTEAAAAAGSSQVTTSSSYIGPPFSPATNAAATLAVSSCHMGGAAAGQRLALAKPRTEFKVNLWSVLKDCIGRDLSRIAMPVYFNEPTSFLQRQCEDLQYVDLLNLVGHHPPITAYVATASEYSCEGWVTVRNRFSGKSLEVTMPGIARVTFRRTGERFSYKRIKMLIHNVIWGKLWIEVDGTSLVQNETSGDFSVVQFLRKGWLDKTCHHLRAIIFDASGRPAYRLSGQWSSAIYVEEAPAFPPHKKWKVPPQVEEFRRSETGPPADSPDNQLDAVITQYWESIAWVESSRRLIWRPTARPPNADQFYGFGDLTRGCMRKGESMRLCNRRTDSKKNRGRLQGLGLVGNRIIHPVGLGGSQTQKIGCTRYTILGLSSFQGGYWEAREAGDWSCCPDIF
ncbi:oxysterol-binding protein, putative [Eimeria necatrix]|uniref:Oxysterol-binding protein, putative n=1 Tax=Eimeria necatrix TaxID=51315 RepID=U6MZ83_9EIME|nr:oxysterol-binding protein, putative [Eimeria necatrix]CDJ69276.1 oxysterol-binding protein, putative [Eimeria necatrix]